LQIGRLVLASLGFDADEPPVEARKDIRRAVVGTDAADVVDGVGPMRLEQRMDFGFDFGLRRCHVSTLALR